jgi:hypothetical protein
MWLGSAFEPTKLPGLVGQSLVRGDQQFVRRADLGTVKMLLLWDDNNSVPGKRLGEIDVGPSGVFSNTRARRHVSDRKTNWTWMR